MFRRDRVGLLLLFALAALAGAARPLSAQVPEDAVAVVNGEAIGIDEFNRHFAQAARQRFYHGAVPAAQSESLRREVVDELILRRLLLGEAERRRIDVDTGAIDGKLRGYAERLGREEDRRAFERQASELRRQLLDNARLRAIEETVRAVADPEESALRDYYDAHAEQFTEPSSNRVGLILIAVQPWETGDVWREAKHQAAEIAEHLRAGADFAALARARSGDRTAAAGGDMGYVHKGMLASVAEESLDKLQPGEISDPVPLLQGYAVFRLMERTPAKLRPLSEVRERAAQLYKRDRGDEQWQGLIASLRRNARIEIATSERGPPGARP